VASQVAKLFGNGNEDLKKGRPRGSKKGKREKRPESAAEGG